MKKQLAFLMLGIFMVSMISAFPYITFFPSPIPVGNINNISQNFPPCATYHNSSMCMLPLNLDGLQHAILVANANATSQIQSNLQMLNLTDANIINRLNSISANNEGNSTIIIGTSQALLLGFIPLQRQYSYQINSDGTMFQNHGIFDFLWRNE